MTDSMLFLASATIFGLAMLTVGWFVHGWRAERAEVEAYEAWKATWRTNARIAYYGGRDAMDRLFLDG